MDRIATGLENVKKSVRAVDAQDMRLALAIPAQPTVSDQLVHFPGRALRIHTRELGAVVLGERTAPAPPIPKQTPAARATALRPDLDSLAVASSREACIPGHR